MPTDVILTVFKTAGDADLMNTFQKLGSGADGVERRLDALKNITGNAMTGAGLVGAAAFAKSLKSGMDSIEADNMVSVTFGNGSMPEIESWSKGLRESLKLNEYALRKDAGVFGSLFKTVGASQGEVVSMSKSVTELSRDLASFGNTSNEEAVNALRSALVGESEPIRKYNVLLNEAAIKNYAYANGIAVAGSELSEAQKVMARYGVILQQTKDAQGDLFRTKDSPANLARAAQEELKNIETDFGRTQEKLMQSALKAAHGILPIVESVADGFGKLPTLVQGLTIGGLIGAKPLLGLLDLIGKTKKGGLGGALGDLGGGAGVMNVSAGVVNVNGGIGTPGSGLPGLPGLADDAGAAAAKSQWAKFTAASAFGVEGAAALGIGLGAAAVAAYGFYEAYEGTKQATTKSDEDLKKNGPLGRFQVSAGQALSDYSPAMLMENRAGDAAEKEAMRMMALNRQRALNRRAGEQSAAASAYNGSNDYSYANPARPAVLARAARSQNARASVNVNVDVPYGPGDYDADDRNSTALAYG
jgi:hypothetical protein